MARPETPAPATQRHPPESAAAGTPAMPPAPFGWDTAVVAGALAACVLLFALWPGLDLLASAQLFVPGVGFAHAQDPLVRTLYDHTPRAGHTMLAALALLALLPPRLAPRWHSSARRRAAVAALCAAVLGPGLLIEGLLKPHWQRPRPVQVQAFGGPEPFVPALRYCAACSHHHSFVSSHAAAGFALLNLGLLARAPRRRAWLAAGLLAGGIVGAGRIAQGGHFASDIVFAFFAVWLSGQLVAWAAWRLARHRAAPPAAASSGML